MAETKVSTRPPEAANRACQAAVLKAPGSTGANLENAFDKKYLVNADRNTNLSPGFGPALRVAVTTAF